VPGHPRDRFLALAEAGRGPAEVFVPQSHRPGAEAEVDFGEVVVWLAGECRLWMLD
jgi:hypothetical protein